MIKIWKEKERLDGEIVDCTTAVIVTRGCSWRKCYMCSYFLESRDLSEKELIDQVDAIFNEKSQVVKIFTSGSFFDEREIPEKVRKYVRDKVKEKGIKKLIVESRPEFIKDEILKDFEGINLEVGIGLESSNDFVREKYINKGFSFEEFKKAASKLRSYGFRVKAYLLLKPPFMSEREALNDVLNSIEEAKDLVDIFSLNLTNVQKNTLVEKLWLSKLYRPPWLWSAVEVLKKADVEIICDPLAAGKSRGPHNCGKCDRYVAKAIRNFSLTQNKKDLEVHCECLEKWKVSLEIEDFSRVPLFD
ncbi:MAG: archaeosine biosynthesis radical SAM protein RaSEA [Archaeoglobaceae archaeon]|nr:archaeosine biosynthesis radical SAM protein RaSEA [Archaeoglobaceae archaeon]MCX8151499.1 archaeosine biosynthesis radical SAM protein RaSEA [Archaeoglobaceae archaeon]MDW8014025.1 archaeosine biosynthesis radical SAM protein RaSEA [Archaeoglobaceae archaeon]